MSIQLYFDSSLNVVNGISPRIRKIWAVPCTASVSELIDFGIDAEDPDGHITGYAWSFGDFYSSYVREPSHRYIYPGLYNVRVTAVDDSGNVSSDSISVTILKSDNIPPRINSFVLQPDSGVTPLTVNFSCEASDADGFIEKYIWSFGDNNGSWTKASRCSHTYNISGNFVVKLIVRDNDWACDTVTDTVKVTGKWIPTLFAFPNPAQTGRDVHFWLDNPDYYGDSSSYIWYLPSDTLTTNNPILHYSFFSPGAFNVKLIVNADTSRQCRYIIQVNPAQ